MNSSDHPSVSISVSFVAVRRRPGPSVQFRRAWSRTPPATTEPPATELESVLGKPSRVRISYPPLMPLTWRNRGTGYACAGGNDLQAVERMAVAVDLLDIARR
jgi:hypothetical protein